VLMEKLGDISGIEVFNNQVLVAIYVRPEKTAKGIYLTESHRKEDEHQGKVGLVVKRGEQAFKSDAKWKWPDLSCGDWVFFRASDGWPVTINRGGESANVLCRILDDVDVRGRVSHPDEVW